MTTTAIAIPASYGELWRTIATQWAIKTARMTWAQRAEDPFHLAFMGLSAQHMEAWEVIDHQGFAPQALIDDLVHFLRIWVLGEAAA